MKHFQPIIFLWSVLSGIKLFWSRWYGSFFFALFLLLCFWIVFIWYYGLFVFHWSDEQKSEYQKSREKRTVLNRDEFEEALRALDRRNEVFALDPESPPEIFRPSEKKTSER